MMRVMFRLAKNSDVVHVTHVVDVYNTGKLVLFIAAGEACNFYCECSSESYARTIVEILFSVGYIDLTLYETVVCKFCAL